MRTAHRKGGGAGDRGGAYGDVARGGSVGQSARRGPHVKRGAKDMGTPGVGMCSGRHRDRRRSARFLLGFYLSTPGTSSTKFFWLIEAPTVI